MKTICVAVVAVLLVWLGSVQAQGKTSLTQEPMYGGADRNLVLQLKIDDDRMVREVTKLYGTRQQASAALVANGFSYYQKDDLVNAMYRFNQAWTVDDANPEVYVGFAAVLNDRRRHCEAMAMMDMALARNPAATRGIYPDAARAVASCALTGVERPTVDRQQLWERSDALFKKAEAIEANQGYVYLSWATVYDWRQQFDQAWRMVAKARAVGAVPDATFLAALRAKMPEPAGDQ